MHLHRLAASFALSLGLAAPALAVDAPAPVRYSFATTPAGWQPISFSFDVPALLQAGDAFSFAPFSISDGVNQWLITQGASTTKDGQGRCFLFGSAGMVLPNGANTTCGLGSSTGEAAFWVFDGQTSLPNAPGQYDGWYVVAYAEGSVATGGQDFNGHLNISSVPEPGAAWLLLAGLGIGALRARRAQI